MNIYDYIHDLCQERNRRLKGVDGFQPVNHIKAVTNLENLIFNYIKNNLADQNFNLSEQDSKKLSSYIATIFNIDIDNLGSRLNEEDNECFDNDEFFDDYCANILINIGEGKSKNELINNIIQLNIKTKNKPICKSTVRGKIDYLFDKGLITQNSEKRYVVTQAGANELAINAFKGYYELDGIKNLLMNYSTNITVGLTKRIIDTFENYGFIESGKITLLGNLLLKD